MTDWRTDAIEAGAQALPGGTTYHMTGDNGFPGTMNRLLAAFVIDAVEPIIRADERERAYGDAYLEGWTEARNVQRDALLALVIKETVAIIQSDDAVEAFGAAWSETNKIIGRGIAPAGARRRAGLRAVASLLGGSSATAMPIVEDLRAAVAEEIAAAIEADCNGDTCVASTHDEDAWIARSFKEEK